MKIALLAFFKAKSMLCMEYFPMNRKIIGPICTWTNFHACARAFLERFETTRTANQPTISKFPFFSFCSIKISKNTHTQALFVQLKI